MWHPKQNKEQSLPVMDSEMKVLSPTLRAHLESSGLEQLATILRKHQQHMSKSIHDEIFIAATITLQGARSPQAGPKQVYHPLQNALRKSVV